MWYFSWILGVLLACSFGIINVLWYEFHDHDFENKLKELEED
ncbi:cytochrome bd-I oxidase subunit CydX [Endozoicomonadaceae bacterium StTr2]